MKSAEIFSSLKSKWVTQVRAKLTNQSALTDDLTDQFIKLFTQLEISLQTSSLDGLKDLLHSWSSSLTESDLKGDEHALAKITQDLAAITQMIILENIQPQEAVELMRDIFPILANAQEIAMQNEISAQTNYYRKKLNEIQEDHERNERSKTGFITIAAHELKTPLTIIEGYTSMLATNLQKNQSSESNAEILDGIQKGTIRLKNLIDDMIDVSLIENDMLVLNYQRVWINRIVEAIIFEIERNVSERKLKIEILPFSGYDRAIKADPERLLQVFRNVISNAIKYTPDGGNIQIHGRLLPGFLETTITDNGIGIDIEDQIKIFNKFSHVGSSSLHSSGKIKFKGGGPGLGLYIAKGIVEKHGGTMWVDSSGYDEQKLPGTSVHILLPAS